MFILFGEKAHATELATGQFGCPLCQQSTTYTHHQVQPYFTVFGINLAKLNICSDYVVCHLCASCYNPQIIVEPEQHSLAVDKAVILRALCYLLSGYGDTKQARVRLIELYQRHTNIQIGSHDIDTEMAVITGGTAPTLPFLKGATLNLSPKAKQDIVLACYQFAQGSCLMEHQDRVRINTIASSIDISLPEVTYLINQQ